MSARLPSGGRRGSRRRRQRGPGGRCRRRRRRGRRLLAGRRRGLRHRDPHGGDRLQRRLARRRRRIERTRQSNALDAAIRAGAQRFVHFSSVRAFGDLGFPDGVDETHPVRPDGAHLRGHEDRLRAGRPAGACRRRDDCAVIRPGDVWAPAPAPGRFCPSRRSQPAVFAPAMGRGIFSPVYVDDLVTGITARGPRPRGEGGQVFTITDGIGVSREDFFGRYSPMLGKSPRPPRTAPGGDGARRPCRRRSPASPAAPRSCAARRSST